jgi:hypothetical protein
VGSPQAVRLQRAADHAQSGVLEARDGDRLVAAFVETAAPSGRSVTLIGRAAPMDPTQIRALLDALVAHDASGLSLATNDPLVRHVARGHGFTGALRGPLVPAASGPWTDLDNTAALRDALADLLPGIDVGAERQAGATRSLLRRAASGVPNLVNLFAAPDAAAPPTRFSVPLRSDLLVESIARCIDTVTAIRRRFGRVASTARRVSFDHSDFQLLTGHHAGSADRSSGIIHMNASMASVEGLTAMETVRAQRGGGGATAVAAPFNHIDGTTAHEMWHQMEGTIEARRAMEGIELRRRLGEALGVETLEQAVNGGRARAPDAWKRAHARLVEEVSAYAGTAPVEATAEMFELWWCSGDDLTPIVRRFGELAEPLLDRYRD